MLLSYFAVLLVACQFSSGAYPVFGTKRYGRSVASWSPMPLPYYQPPRASRPFVSPYYDADTLEYYYPQDPYGYFPTPPEKYPVYQSLVPYYYSEQRRPYGYYGYEEGTDPVDDIQEEILEEDREERGETLPYGQETWYGGNAQDGNAEANAVFLQNLILAQMYNDGRYPYVNYPTKEDETESWVYGEPKAMKTEPATKEDEDVRELKSLLRKEPDNKKSRRDDVDDVFGGQMDNSKQLRKEWQYKRSDKGMTTGRKLRTGSPVSTEAPSTVVPQKGQKEVVLPRPATPVRAPHFQKFVNTRSREPSVYDTIKKLLHMQEQLEQVRIEITLYISVELMN